MEYVTLHLSFSEPLHTCRRFTDARPVFLLDIGVSSGLEVARKGTGVLSGFGIAPP
jgi:hypothetical protein